MIEGVGSEGLAWRPVPQNNLQGHDLLIEDFRKQAGTNPGSWRQPQNLMSSQRALSAAEEAMFGGGYDFSKELGGILSSMPSLDQRPSARAIMDENEPVEVSHRGTSADNSGDNLQLAQAPQHSETANKEDNGGGASDSRSNAADSRSAGTTHDALDTHNIPAERRQDHTPRHGDYTIHPQNLPSNGWDAPQVYHVGRPPGIGSGVYADLIDTAMDLYIQALANPNIEHSSTLYGSPLQYPWAQHTPPAHFNSGDTYNGRPADPEFASPHTPPPEGAIPPIVLGRMHHHITDAHDYFSEGDINNIRDNRDQINAIIGLDGHVRIWNPTDGKYYDLGNVVERWKQLHPGERPGQAQAH